jgi:hypothetical protein
MLVQHHFLFVPFLSSGDYWIPPTPAPTVPCPDCSEVCSSGNFTTLSSEKSMGGDDSQNGNGWVSLFLAALGGAAAVVVIGAIVNMFGRDKRHEYATIPN